MRLTTFDPSARKILRVEMSKRELTYADLVRGLRKLGIEDNERNVRNKIARGTFSADFFVQCLYALKLEQLDLRHFGPMRERPVTTSDDD